MNVIDGKPINNVRYFFFIVPLRPLPYNKIIHAKSVDDFKVLNLIQLS